MNYNLLLESALNACGELYGVFSREQFEAVARARTHNELTADSYRGFWTIMQRMDKSYWLQPLTDGVLYNGNRMNRAEAVLNWQALQPLKPRYVPDDTAMDELDRYDLHLPQSQQSRLNALLEKYTFLFYRSTSDMRNLILGLLNRGVPPRDVVSKLPRNSFSYSFHKQEFSDELTSLLIECLPWLPLMQLGGYSMESWRKAGLGEPPVGNLLSPAKRRR